MFRNKAIVLILAIAAVCLTAFILVKSNSINNINTTDIIESETIQESAAGEEFIEHMNDSAEVQDSPELSHTSIYSSVSDIETTLENEDLKDDVVTDNDSRELERDDAGIETQNSAITSEPHSDVSVTVSGSDFDPNVTVNNSITPENTPVAAENYSVVLENTHSAAESNSDAPIITPEITGNNTSASESILEITEIEMKEVDARDAGNQSENEFETFIGPEPNELPRD